MQRINSRPTEVNFVPKRSKIMVPKLCKKTALSEFQLEHKFCINVLTWTGWTVVYGNGA